MSAEEITVEHLVSFMKKKMIKKDYGSVMIHLQSGKITQVIENNTFNPSSFIVSAEKPINHLLVKSNKQTTTVIPIKKRCKVSKVNDNNGILDTNDEICNNETTEKE